MPVARMGAIDPSARQCTIPAKSEESPVSEEPVLVEARPTYRVITLNRPSRLNAITVDLHRALADALDKAETDKSCRSILLRGAGRGFCAGQDLSDVEPPTAGKPTDLGLLIDRHYNP